MEPAKRFIINKFSSHDIFLLGESHAIKQTLDFVSDLIPSLYVNGIYNLVMEFGCYENQEKLDALLTSDIYQAELARDMMFDYNVGWPYVEYLNIYKTVFELNKKLGKNQKKFRIINMSYIYHWEEYDGILDYESARKIFDKGCIDLFRANIIEREVLDKGEKALVLTGAKHAFTKYRMIQFVYNHDDLCEYQSGGLGQRLHEKYKDRITNAIVHRNFLDRHYNSISPASGQVEEILGEQEYVGIDLSVDPIGELSDNSRYAIGYQNFKLKDLADNYIYLVSNEKQDSATIDYHFLDGRDYNEVIKAFPDPHLNKVPQNINEYYEQIKGRRI